MSRRSDLGNDAEYYVDYDRPELATVIQSLPPCDGIVHLATNVDFSTDARIEDFHPTSVLATKLLCERAEEWQGQVVFASGTLVLGPRSFVDEHTRPAPVNAYARAKLLGEEIVRGSSAPHTVLRIGGIFGRHGPAHLGLNRVIDDAIDNGRVPTVFGRGLAQRNYIYVEDLANTVIDCLEEKILGTHLAAGTETGSIAEMFEDVCKVFLPGATPNYEEGDEAPDMVANPSVALPSSRGFHKALMDIRDHE